ncbi:ATP-binding cassette domain-containing protein [Streptomyces mirabilis]|uniref:ATP-binding cassette domain-containing protein n=1 Tax=Streptomyces mirabilis TaxID=68239 RepID=UPI0036911F71
MAGSDGTAPATARRTALRVTGLSWPDSGASVLEPVTFDVVAGEVVTLVAPDRTTVVALLLLLSGIAVAGTGTIELDGVDVTAEPAYQRVRRGLVRSYPLRTLWVGMTVEDHVRVAVQAAQEAAWRPWRGDPAHQAVTDHLLARTGLAGRATTPSSHLSPDEQKRLEVAIMLADNPSIVLLDDPLTGVPHDEAEKLIALIRSLRDEDGRTVLMTAPPECADRLEPLSDRAVALRCRHPEHGSAT